MGRASLTGAPSIRSRLERSCTRLEQFADEDLDEENPLIEAEIQANLRGESLRPERPAGRGAVRIPVYSPEKRAAVKEPIDTGRPQPPRRKPL